MINLVNNTLSEKVPECQGHSESSLKSIVRFCTDYNRRILSIIFWSFWFKKASGRIENTHRPIYSALHSQCLALPVGQPPTPIPWVRRALCLCHYSIETEQKACLKNDIFEFRKSSYFEHILTFLRLLSTKKKLFSHILLEIFVFFPKNAHFCKHV
jgi:hypothetical protein